MLYYIVYYRYINRYNILQVINKQLPFDLPNIPDFLLQSNPVWNVSIVDKNFIEVVGGCVDVRVFLFVTSLQWLAQPAEVVKLAPLHRL